MLAWLTGGTVGLAVGALLDTGIVARASIRDDTAIGYWTATYLYRRRYPYQVNLDAVTFTRARHDL